MTTIAEKRRRVRRRAADGNPTVRALYVECRVALRDEPIDWRLRVWQDPARPVIRIRAWADDPVWGLRYVESAIDEYHLVSASLPDIGRHFANAVRNRNMIRKPPLQ